MPKERSPTSDLIANTGEFTNLDRQVYELTYEQEPPRNEEELRNHVIELLPPCLRAFELNGDIKLRMGEIASTPTPTRARMGANRI